MNQEDRPCIVEHCPLPAEYLEEGEAGAWIVRLYYCREHGREREKGTPMGGLAVDGCFVEFVSKETSEPQPGGNFFAISPQ